ncbi:maltotransferase domain-containing protein [Jatrophihabitans sp. YIM 134969]
MVGRLGLTQVSPTVEGGYSARAVVGEQVPLQATAFREGHDAIGASVALRAPDGRRIPFLRMTSTNPGLDRFGTVFVPDAPGMWTFTVEAWADPFSTWEHAVAVKIEAGQGAEDLANDLEEGARLFERLGKQVAKGERPTVLAVAATLRDTSLDLAHRVAPALEDPATLALIRDFPVREHVTRSAAHKLWVDRPRALYGSWYELFPRSVGAELAGDPLAPAKPARHGTFRDVLGHLDYVADLGFDVVYFPPIHPIGEVNRKGPNNTLVAQSWDVGSPWAIGSRHGGHEAVHPELGTIEDFKAVVDRAHELGMEVALDWALSAAPDHPWVTEHPDWFTTKPDGTIAYAENPPKKYQDIYNFNFDNDPKGIDEAFRAAIQVWIDCGVKIFRVDNPHTKPLNFWQRHIESVKKDHPDVLFLAEAFTRPPMMHELAKLGYTQSYTYFTWRNTVPELREYLEELVAASHYMRPNFFPVTPDILPFYLQTSGPAGFAIRAILAATLAPTYGIYSGYEVYEHLPLAPGREEYLDSEKFQLRPRDLVGAMADGRSLAPLLRDLNRIRREHPALQYLANLRFHESDNDAVLVYSKRLVQDDGRVDTVIVVVNTDPSNVREATITLDMAELGYDWNDRFEVVDALNGDRFSWGQYDYVRLDPYWHPAHVLVVTNPR